MKNQKIRIGVICFDLQNFTADFLNRLHEEVKEFAILKAYPIVDNIGDLELKFTFAQGEKLENHKVKSYSDNKKHTPEGLLLSPNYKNAINCSVNSDIILHYGIHSSTALISGFLGFLLRKKQISINQTLPITYERKRRWWVIWSKYMFFKFCDLHVAQSKVTMPNLIDIYKIEQKRIRYIPFEAGIHSFQSKYNKINTNKLDNINRELKSFKFLFVGNLLIFKGIYIAIEAMNILIKEKNMDLRLSIVGSESIDTSEPRIPEIKSYIKDLGLENSIEVLGSKSLDQLVSIYEQSDVIILPTMRDMFPKVLVEAGIAGKPMITSDASGAVDTIVIDEVNGFICKAGSVEDLAICMEKIANREVLKKMAIETKKIIDQYLIDTQNEAFEYSQLIKELML